MPFYGSLDPEGKGKEFGHDIFEELPLTPASFPLRQYIMKLRHMKLSMYLQNSIKKK